MPGVSSQPAELTVVIATHNRADVLACTLACLCAQTFRDWTALVIGDCCDERTGDVVLAARDARLRYINLPHRCGDQSGPNSIGAHLNRSPLLAFLNHDDLLLPDHLERCVTVLRQEAADVCIAPAARAVGWADTVPPEILYQRSDVPPLTLARVARAGDELAFEPVSAWVMTAEAYGRVGDWVDGADLYRTPFNDWLLRASRARLRVVRTSDVSVVHMLMHSAREAAGPVYGRSAAFHQQLAEEIRLVSAEVFRGRVSSRIADPQCRRLIASWKWRRLQAASPVEKIRRTLRAFAGVAGMSLSPVVRPAMASALEFGWDPYAGWCRLRGRRRGWWKRRAVHIRTGDQVLRRTDRRLLLAEARAVLEQL